jgi:maleylpyruvate isomerase
LADADLDADTLLDCWTRKHLIAHDGYNAAALCRLLDWAATGVETPMYDSTEQRAREIKEVRRAAGRGAVALTTGADQDQPRCL